MVREDADQRYGTADKSRVWMMQGRESERNVVYNTQTKEMGRGWGEDRAQLLKYILEKMYGRVSFNFIYLLLNSFKLRGVLSQLLAHLPNEMLNFIHSFRFCCQYLCVECTYTYSTFTKYSVMPCQKVYRIILCRKKEKSTYKTYVHK